MEESRHGREDAAIFLPFDPTPNFLRAQPGQIVACSIISAIYEPFFPTEARILVARIYLTRTQPNLNFSQASKENGV